MHLITLLFPLLPLYYQPVKTPLNHRPVTVDTVTIDTSRYAVLPFNKQRDEFLFSKDFEPADLTADDVVKIEKVIRIMAAEYNNKIRAQNDKDSKADLSGLVINNPTNYYKQIIAVINAKKEKEVWVNCFCTALEKRHWRKGVIVILDGGSCFFNIKINLTTNTVIAFNVNGLA